MLRVVNAEMEGGALIVEVESDLEGAQAIDELQSADTRRLALEHAQGKINRPGIDSVRHYPVDAHGRMIDLTGADGNVPVFSYRAKVKVVAGIL